MPVVWDTGSADSPRAVGMGSQMRLCPQPTGHGVAPPETASTVAASGRARPSEVTGVLGRALGREGGAWHTPCF